MRPATLLFALPLVLAACSEAPRCVDRGTPERPNVVIECNAGKVPVCGNDPAALYDESGALRPVPDDAVADGRCPDGVEDCRTRPVCEQDTMNVVCNDGTTPTCVLGSIEELDPPPTPTPDAGGQPDAGTTPADAGASDAGTADAGDGDAGASDAGTADAGIDAGA